MDLSSISTEDLISELDKRLFSNNKENTALTVQEVYDSMTDVQKEVLHFMIGEALKQ